MKKLVLMSVVALASTPAYAQTVSGARAEFTAGYDSTNGKVTYDEAIGPLSDFSESKTSTGAVFGGTAGYDFAISNKIFVGVEGSVDFASNKHCEDLSVNEATCFSVKRHFAIGGRVGTQVTDSMRLYVGAAYANGKARVSFKDELDATNSFSVSNSRGGIRLSGGIEAQIAGNFYTKAEYRYTTYQDYKMSDESGDLSLGFDRHQVLAGFGVRF